MILDLLRYETQRDTVIFDFFGVIPSRVCRVAGCLDFQNLTRGKQGAVQARRIEGVSGHSLVSQSPWFGSVRTCPASVSEGLTPCTSSDSPVSILLLCCCCAAAGLLVADVHLLIFFIAFLPQIDRPREVIHRSVCVKYGLNIVLRDSGKSLTH